MSTAGDDMYKFEWPFPRRSSLLFKICSNIVLTSVFLASKLLFSFNWNRITVSNKEKLLRLLADRSRPLITIANHRCTVDDPLLWTIFSFREFFANVSRFRYALAAHNICFTNAWHSKFFSLGLCVPVVRGAGVYQRGVDFCIEKLAENRWVHVFPEGKVTPHPIRIKWGVARMIMECPTPPMVLPIWIQRMNEVWSPSPPYHPLFGKHVHVTIGDELDMRECLPHLCGNTEIERRKAIADLVQERLFDLGEKLETQLQN
uniref:Tafazzin family protein n=1 Tax=Ascaris suum TaxID=6253 RepID=F1L6A9_ASCSU